MSASTAIPEPFFASAPERLQMLRAGAIALREPQSARPELLRMAHAAQELKEAGELNGCHNFSQLAEKLKVIFEAARRTPLNGATQVALDFVAEALAVMEVDLMMRADFSLEAGDAFSAFRRKYGPAYDPQGGPAPVEPYLQELARIFALPGEPPALEAVRSVQPQSSSAVAPGAPSGLAPLTSGPLGAGPNSVLFGALGKVLLIDSDVYFARMLQEALRQEGLDVVHSPSAGYALTMLEADPPAAIVSSTSMPELGALDIPAILAADPKTANIPVVAIGDGGDQALMAAFRAGCEQYVDARLGPDHTAVQVRLFMETRFKKLLSKDATPETSLSGSMATLELAGLIQMLAQLRQSGALQINTPAFTAVIFFELGLIAHAVCGEVTGEEAVRQVIKACTRSREGTYRFSSAASADTRTVFRTATELMLDAVRELDEEQEHGPQGGNG